jgi:hypothetical protein
MKGGITSGVTYPLAVCAIARTYRLRNLGGTSAGAIAAAAAAAAAEVGRDKPGAGFVRLAKLPDRIASKPQGTNSVLLSLFRPSRETAPLHRIFIGSMKAKGGKIRKALRTAWAILRGSPLAALAGCGPGAIIATLLIRTSWTHPSLRSNAVVVAGLALGTVLGVLFALLGAFGATLWNLARRALRVLPSVGYGIAPGFVAGGPAPAGTEHAEDLQTDEDGKIGPKPLTTWLADEIDAMAGNEGPEPLTLGDLAKAGVNLRMFTTNLTLGTPYTLPFRDRSFYFNPEEFRKLFPKRVVDWMVENQPQPRNKDAAAFERMRTHKPSLLPFPDPANLPVVVMTRFSLSFPVLLSAIPLWTLVARATKEVKPGEDKMKVIRCWFSDGGITSNFPIHFFDGPIPRWPTFGLNLAPGTHLDLVDQSKNIEASCKNLAGIQARWGDIKSVGGFAHAILDTMQNWMDSAQVRVPGYRDRIVTILHTHDEGGMNLDMPNEVIKRFSDRGQAAGEFLVNRFSGPVSTNPGDDLSWDNHRWLRYRSVMPLLENMVIRMAKVYDWPPQPAGGRTHI